MIRSCSIPPSEAHVKAAVRVVESGVWVHGAETAALESEFAGWLWGGLDPDRVVAVSSGTAALTALLLCYGIGPGDEVIVPAVTFTATAVAVARTGARPVFADVNETWTISSGGIEEMLTHRTRAIIGVDFDGIPADWNRIEQTLATHLREDVKLIEDACPAYGSRYVLKPSRAGTNRTTPAGLLGRDGAAFSLNESKQLPAGEGGLVVAPNPEVAERIRRMRHFGHDRFGGRVSVEPTGDNWKITEMAAAVARAGIPSLRERVMKSKLHAEILRRAVGGSGVLSAPPVPVGSEPSWFRIRVVAATESEAMRIARVLEEADVPLQLSSEVAHLPAHPMFFDARRGSMKNSRQLARTFCVGGRSRPVFDAETTEVERWAEVIRSLPS